MESESSGNGSPGCRKGDGIVLPIPVQGSELFNHRATPHILNFLSDNPYISTSIRQLATITPVSERATREAVNALEASGLVRVNRNGNARRVQIDRDRLQLSDDPISRIPQSEYHFPVRIARRYLQEELDAVRGVVLFGSVARGQADRQSDIDLWILVESDVLEQRHQANKLQRKLETLQIPTAVPFDSSWTDENTDWKTIKQQLEGSEPTESAQRYSFEFVVEDPESILNQSDRLDGDELFGEGITLYSTPTLEKTKEVLLSHE